MFLSALAMVMNLRWCTTELWWIMAFPDFSLTVLQGYDKQAMYFVRESTHDRAKQHHIWEFKDRGH
jgi:hypothetical protein